MSDVLRVGMVGYAFMGAAHAQAWRNAHRFFDLPLTPVLADMEMSGIGLDLPFFQETSRRLEKRMSEIEKNVFEMVGKPFNINSTQQLSDVLFKTLGLEPPVKGNKTASGHFSTAAGVLEELSGKHPVVDWVLEHRELSKIKSTYVDALPVAINPKTDRVHTSYSQIGAVTGRLSSNNPNLQNIPIRSETGRRVRNGFIAGKGKWLLSVDYSQIELRIVAHMAQDEGMLSAFRADEDIHATTAAAHAASATIPRAARSLPRGGGESVVDMLGRSLPPHPERPFSAFFGSLSGFLRSLQPSTSELASFRSLLACRRSVSPTPSLRGLWGSLFF